MKKNEKRLIQFKDAVFEIEPKEYWVVGSDRFLITDIKKYGEKVKFPTLAKGIKIVGIYLKKKYENIKELVIPDGLHIEFFNNLCFPDLENLIISPTNKEYSSDGKMLFDKNGETLIMTLAAGNNDVVVVPKKVKHISNGAFYHAKCKEIIFENPNVQAELKAFADSAWLNAQIKKNEDIYVGNTLLCAMSDTSVVIKPQTTRINKEAFSSHMPKELTTHIIPPYSALQSSRYSCSGGCYILTLTMDKKKINLNALSNWNNLEAIYFTNHKLYKDIDGVVFSKDGSALLFYPRNRKDETYIVPKGTKIIGRRAFAGAYNLKKVVMPDTVKQIYQGAFLRCAKLKEAVLSDNVTEIPDATAFQPEGVFEYCKSLEKVCLPQKLTHLGTMAFAYCERLKEIEIPNKVQSIGEYAFFYTGINEITLPKSLKNIGKGALLFELYNEKAKVCAYEGTARGLISAIEAVLPGTLEGTANLIWHSAEITMLDKSGKVKDTIIIPENLKKSSGIYIDIAWNSEKFDYDEYDACFADIASADEKTDMAIRMIKLGRDITDTPYESYLKRVSSRIVEQIIDACDEKRLVEFLKYGFLTKSGLKVALRLCNEKGLNTAAAYLLKTIGEEKPKKETAIRL